MNELIDQIGNIGYGRVTIMKRYEAYNVSRLSRYVGRGGFYGD